MNDYAKNVLIKNNNKVVDSSASVRMQSTNIQFHHNQIMLGDGSQEEQPADLEIDEVDGIMNDTSNLLPPYPQVPLLSTQPTDYNSAKKVIDELTTDIKKQDDEIKKKNETLKEKEAELSFYLIPEEIQMKNALEKVEKEMKYYGFNGVASKEVYHAFKIPGFSMPGGDYCSIPCDNIKEAENIVRSRFNSKYDAACFMEKEKKLYMKKIPGVGKPIKNAIGTVFQVGIAQGDNSNKNDKNNVFELRNMDAQGGDIKHVDAMDIYFARRKIVREFKNYGDCACNPWGYQRGIWYKNWCNSAPLVPFKGTHLWIYGASVGELKSVSRGIPCSPCYDNPCAAIVRLLHWAFGWIFCFLCYPFGQFYCLFSEVLGCFWTD